VWEGFADSRVHSATAIAALLDRYRAAFMSQVEAERDKGFEEWWGEKWNESPTSGYEVAKAAWLASRQKD
jgi:hypothetical protein